MLSSPSMPVGMSRRVVVMAVRLLSGVSMGMYRASREKLGPARMEARGSPGAQPAPGGGRAGGEAEEGETDAAQPRPRPPLGERLEHATRLLPLALARQEPGEIEAGVLVLRLQGEHAAEQVDRLGPLALAAHPRPALEERLGGLGGPAARHQLVG